jgi:hypothetical protein
MDLQQVVLEGDVVDSLEHWLRALDNMAGVLLVVVH